MSAATAPIEDGGAKAHRVTANAVASGPPQPLTPERLHRAVIAWRLVRSLDPSIVPDGRDEARCRIEAGDPDVYMRALLHRAQASGARPLPKFRDLRL